MDQLYGVRKALDGSYPYLYTSSREFAERMVRVNEEQTGQPFTVCGPFTDDEVSVMQEASASISPLTGLAI